MEQTSLKTSCPEWRFYAVLALNRILGEAQSSDIKRHVWSFIGPAQHMLLTFFSDDCIKVRRFSITPATAVQNKRPVSGYFDPDQVVHCPFRTSQAFRTEVFDATTDSRDFAISCHTATRNKRQDLTCTFTEAGSKRLALIDRCSPQDEQRCLLKRVQNEISFRVGDVAACPEHGWAAAIRSSWQGFHVDLFCLSKGGVEASRGYDLWETPFSLLVHGDLLFVAWHDEDRHLSAIDVYRPAERTRQGVPQSFGPVLASLTFEAPDDWTPDIPGGQASLIPTDWNGLRIKAFGQVLAVLDAEVAGTRDIRLFRVGGADVIENIPFAVVPGEFKDVALTSDLLITVSSYAGVQVRSLHKTDCPLITLSIGTSLDYPMSLCLCDEKELKLLSELLEDED
eukprot:TRINITY_DN93538_c0_g1_i1.p1 TRINITY_DN93538_c0_g1~~TRINITY_DN93538_c0_g1_i1.p1  ORF type:complete len:396 (+),score=54.06 TRINITY_DN93538_c0_g1_i1:59-1246(+)